MPRIPARSRSFQSKNRLTFLWNIEVKTDREPVRNSSFMLKNTWYPNIPDRLSASLPESLIETRLSPAQQDVHGGTVNEGLSDPAQGSFGNIIGSLGTHHQQGGLHFFDEVEQLADGVSPP
jgi:hypothetical protein